MPDDTRHYETLARMARALGSPTRLRLLSLLSQCERPVDSLAEAADEPLKSVSHHLQRLKQAGLVRARREGRQIVYRLADADVASFFVRLRDFADARSTSQEGDNPVAEAPAPLAELIAAGDVTVLDVRPAEEFEACHVPGAVSVPLDELQERLGDLSNNGSYVVYCRGPYCLLADKAVALLGAAGRQARRARDGVTEWSVAGLPLETSRALD